MDQKTIETIDLKPLANKPLETTRFPKKTSPNAQRTHLHMDLVLRIAVVACQKSPRELQENAPTSTVGSGWEDRNPTIKHWKNHDFITMFIPRKTLGFTVFFRSLSKAQHLNTKQRPCEAHPGKAKRKTFEKHMAMGPNPRYSSEHPMLSLFTNIQAFQKAKPEESQPPSANKGLKH